MGLPAAASDGRTLGRLCDIYNLAPFFLSLAQSRSRRAGRPLEPTLRPGGLVSSSSSCCRCCVLFATLGRPIAQRRPPPCACVNFGREHEPVAGASTGAADGAAAGSVPSSGAIEKSLERLFGRNHLKKSAGRPGRKSGGGQRARRVQIVRALGQGVAAGAAVAKK
jgi:hypothetical protein